MHNETRIIKIKGKVFADEKTFLARMWMEEDNEVLNVHYDIGRFETFYEAENSLKLHIDRTILYISEMQRQNENIQLKIVTDNEFLN